MISKPRMHGLAISQAKTHEYCILSARSPGDPDTMRLQPCAAETVIRFYAHLYTPERTSTQEYPTLHASHKGCS